MIKLIAIDMDGTLLNSAKQIPLGFFEVVSELSAKGVKFIIASGRSYQTLKDNMGEYSHLFTYLTDNGTLVYDNDVCVYSNVLLDADVNAVLDIVTKLPYGICVSTKSGVLIKRETYDMYHEAYKHYYHNQKIVDDYYQIKDIVKFALYDPTCNFLDINVLDSLKTRLSVFSSGPDWFDIQNQGVSKGASLERWSRENGFKPDEIMAFGDAMNDFEMIKFAGYGVAMANADERVKAVAKHITSSNDDNGVMIILEQLLKNDCEICDNI